MVIRYQPMALIKLDNLKQYWDPWLASHRNKKEKEMEKNRFYSEKEVCFRQNLTNGVNAVQKSHKHSHETAYPGQSDSPGCPNNLCLHLLASNVLVGTWLTTALTVLKFLYASTNKFKSCVLLHNTKTSGLLSPCLQVFLLKYPYPGVLGTFFPTCCDGVLDYSPS